MGRQPSLEVKRHLTSIELRKLIKEEQKRGKVLQRLIFINDLYNGKSVPEASKDVGVVKAIAYEWLRRWNESGYEGLIPRFAGGKPGKLTKDQKEELTSNDGCLPIIKYGNIVHKVMSNTIMRRIFWWLDVSLLLYFLT